MVARALSYSGWLIAIIAVSSLIEASFSKQAVQYLQGLVGDLLNLYRTLRDWLFGALGWSSTALINWLRQWLEFVPLAPWFDLPNWAKDTIGFYLLFGRAVAYPHSAGFSTRHELLGGDMYAHVVIPKRNFAIVLWNILFWPIILIFDFIKLHSVVRSKIDGWQKDLLRSKLQKAFLRFLIIVIGNIAFFGLAYLESTINKL